MWESGMRISFSSVEHPECLWGICACVRVKYACIVSVFISVETEHERTQSASLSNILKCACVGVRCAYGSPIVSYNPSSHPHQQEFLLLQAYWNP